MTSCLFRDGEADLLGERLFDLDGVLEADRLGEVLALLARHEHGHVLALLLGNLLALGFWHLQRKGSTYRVTHVVGENLQLT